MKFLFKSISLASLLVFISTQNLHATHYRAGEILYRLIGNFQYEATIITFSKTSSVQADRPFVEINWGDGTIDTIARVNGPGQNGQELANDIKKNIYIARHTYAGAPPPPIRYYIISFFDVNRIDQILNMGDGLGSVNVPFYVEDTLRFPTDLSNIGFNSSPILTYDPIDYANVNDTFYHNPGAYDPDQTDSLDFKLIPCLQNQGVITTQYLYPDQYCKSIGVQPNNSITINPRNGLIIWATPCVQGIFNIAILITEYRGGINIGSMIRDMQIIVNSNPNNPPQITDLKDTCIRAGERLRVNLSATDDNPSQTVTIGSTGGPYQVSSSPAVFNAISGNPASATFIWQTDCSHVQGQDYIVVFKAEDNYTVPSFPNPDPRSLVDIETWQVHVIAPPPLGLTAVATNQSVTLNWQNPYLCASSPRFRGFSIWRKVGCDSFVPNYCETGLAGRGYTKISTTNTFAYTFVDQTSVVGQEYSYRIVAHFSQLSPNGLFQFDPTESVASDEICVATPIDVPVLINVDIKATDVANGQIFIRWTKPLAGGNNLDTIISPPPYRFDLYRGNGANFTAPVLIYSTVDAASFSALVDTFYTDNSLDTKTTPWSYKVLFYANNDTIGGTAIASSVFLTVQPSDQSLILSWQENVPWTNDSFAIYRQNKITSIFEPIDTAYTRTYVDTGLINDTTYCYLVKTYGHYESAAITRPLINASQEECGVPVDTVPPCPPTLAVRNDCNLYNGEVWDATQYINYLTWSLQNDPCSEDITRYYIYYGNDSASMQLIDSITSKADTFYNHILTLSLAGCYAVTALDRIGNQSPYSNVFCIDNCPYYVLPNVFTPNGDGKNETFHPFKPYRFISKIEMKIFNRWGEEIFSTEDPEIGWNGTDQKGKEVSEGVYLYAGFYYEKRLSGDVKRPLSGEKKGGGFIHLIRGK